MKTTTTSTTTTTPAPVEFTSRRNWPEIPIAKNETSWEERLLERDSLRSSSRENGFNLGDFDMKDFDISKILSAAGIRNDENSNAPMVVRFTAPSSDSHLDPAFISKLISGELGKDAQFSVMPLSGMTPKLKESQKKGTKLEDMRGGFKHVDRHPAPAAHYSSKPGPPSPKSTKNTYPIKTSELYRNEDDEFTKWGKPFKNFQSHVRPLPTEATKSTLFHPESSIIRHPKHERPSPTTNSFSPSPPTGSSYNNYFPSYPKAPSDFAKESHVSGPVKYEPTASPSRYATSASYNNNIATSIERPSEPHPPKYAGYSTLSQQMKAPDLTPPITGQYKSQKTFSIPPKPVGGKDAKDAEFSPQKPPKYSATFVRGFTDDDGIKDTRLLKQNHYQYKAGNGPPRRPSPTRSQWKNLQEVPEPKEYSDNRSPRPFPRPPSQSFNLPKPSFRHELPDDSSFMILKPNGENARPGLGSTKFINQDYESKPQIDNHENYTPVRGNKGNRGGHHDYDQINPTAAYAHGVPPPTYRTPHREYVPPLPLKQENPISHVQEPLITYGKPHEQNLYSPPPSFPTKTIYVNLPPEPTRTAPKFYRQIVLPQKHYKIIFVKAPTAPPPEEPEIEVTPPPERKTIIYVLHKKPEPTKKAVIKPPPSTKPPPPQVYFIQYKENEEDGQQEKGKWVGSENEGRKHHYGFSPGNEDKSNNWSPIFSSGQSKSDSLKDDSLEQGYPISPYELSASASTPIRVSVKATVSSKI